jgi:hypothetical protein
MGETVKELRSDFGEMRRMLGELKGVKEECGGGGDVDTPALPTAPSSPFNTPTSNTEGTLGQAVGLCSLPVSHRHSTPPSPSHPTLRLRHARCPCAVTRSGVARSTNTGPSWVLALMSRLSRRSSSNPSKHHY